MKLRKFVVKKWKLLAILLIFVIGIIFFILKNNKSEVESIVVQKGKISEELTLSGEINATNYAKLGFETSGKIVYVGVKEGESIKKGKLLSKLDTTVLNSNYQIALSNLRIYEATVANIHDQVKNHDNDESYAQKDLRTTAEANKDKAYEVVLQAKRSLDGASLYAPFNGIVTYVAHPFSGVYTSLGVTEVEVIDPNTIYFNVLADQTEVTKLVIGQKVEIILDSFEEKMFEGVVKSISFVPKIGESSSVYSVKVEFVGVNLLESKFKIAMTGDAKFIILEKENTLYVPSGYIKQDKTGEYLKTNSKNGKVYIKSGISSEEMTEVIGDVDEGMTVYD